MGWENTHSSLEEWVLVQGKKFFLEEVMVELRLKRRAVVKQTRGRMKRAWSGHGSRHGRNTRAQKSNSSVSLGSKAGQVVGDMVGVVARVIAHHFKDFGFSTYHFTEECFESMPASTRNEESVLISSYHDLSFPSEGQSTLLSRVTTSCRY